MATTFKADAERSKKNADTYLALLMKKYRCSFASTENHDNTADAYLDQDCGIDFIFRDTQGNFYPCASRVIEMRRGGKNYDCFSVRDERANGNRTECQKFYDVTKPRPKLNIQIFVDTAVETAKVAIAKTEEIFNFLFKREAETLKTKSGDVFKIAKWKDLAAAGIKVSVFKICATTGEVTKLSVENLNF